MARLYQAGSLNTTALTVPDLYVQIVAPQTLINGVSSSRVGIVGTAGWGPVNTAQVVGSMGDYLAAFGAKQPLVTDMGIAVNAAILQGASDFVCVRVTDGTDAVATQTVSGVAVIARYTGTAGNAIVASVVTGPGSNFTFTTSHPVLGTQAYAGASWAAISEQVNTDPNAVVVLHIPANIGTPVAGSGTLGGGLDGGTPNTAAFLGSDGTPRTGLYALRGTGCAIGLIHGLSDPASYTAQAAFGLGEGVYMIATGPSGDTIADAVSTKASAGLDSYAVKLMFGDWLWWNDDTNGMMLISPQAFAAGILASLSPEQSSLNKQLFGVVGSQKAGQTASGSAQTYSSAELSTLFSAGIDVICNPAPGGSYWAVRCGHNSSSRAVVNGDSYTRMTNYIAETLAAGMGVYVGSVINDTLFGDIRATLLGFLSSLLSQGVLGTVNGALPYRVVCDATNNPQARIALGYVQCDVAVQYQGINEKFIVNLQGGASVTVTASSGSV